MKYLDSNENSKNDLIQGSQYLKFRNKYDNNAKNDTTLEGFSGIFTNESTPIKTKNDNDFKELTTLKEDYDKLKNEYSTKHKALMSKMDQYFLIRNSTIKGQNIKMGDPIGYLSNNGVFKGYPSMTILNNTAGKNGCPAFNDLKDYTGKGVLDFEKSTLAIDNEPVFKVGKLMQEGQSCGYEGENVFVKDTGSAKNIEFTYINTFNNSSSSGLVNEGNYEVTQDENGFNRCKQLAYDTGSSVFAFANGGTEGGVKKLKCYVGKDIYKITGNDLGIISETIWQSNDNNSNPIFGGDHATLNAAGQLLIRSMGKTESNLLDGLTCVIYSGYMGATTKGTDNTYVDDVNYFKNNTSKLLKKVNNVNLFGSIQEATKNNFPGNSPTSVEWTGYFKPSGGGIWGFDLTSDDCSYMWIGSSAKEGYTLQNAFINNNGLHAPVKISRRINLIKDQYYPVRIQFGQNYGGSYFKLDIVRPDGGKNNDGTGKFFSTNDQFNDQLYSTTGETWINLWQTEKPTGTTCDEKSGGNINLEDSISNWGVNCNSRTTNAWGNPANYNVPIGNMNTSVYNMVNNKSTGNVVIGQNMGDPAYGCPKSFYSTYRCGNSNSLTKQISINGEAYGKVARYNCFDEMINCYFLIQVQDDCNLVIYKGKINSSTREISFEAKWNTSTYNYNTKAVPVDAYKASKGKNGRHYLLPGETLNDGEFIGSPSGKCYLKMSKTSGLQLFYNKINNTSQNNNFIVDSNNQNIKWPGPNSPNTETLTVYTLPVNDGLSSIGNVSYVNSDSELMEYPNNSIQKGSQYVDLGNYNNPNSKNIKEFDADSPELCKTECNKLNDCDGFVYGGSKCFLKDNSIYPATLRYAENNVNLYKRIPNVINNNSCSKKINTIDADRWSKYLKTDKMSTDELCGLSNHTKEQKDQLNEVLNRLNNKANEIYSKLSNMTSEQKKILENYGLNENKIKKDMENINLIEKEYPKLKTKLRNMYGIETVSERELIHNNYNYMLWSILAIVLVIGGMKMLKK
jgi:hypothetical protein